MATKFDSRQTQHIAALNTISSTSPTALDTLVTAVDNLLTPPFNMRKTTTRTIALGASLVNNTGTTRKHISAPYNGAVPYTFTGGNITTPSVSGGNIAYGGVTLAITVASGNYIRVGVFVSNAGVVSFTVGSENVDLTSASTPTPNDGKYAVGEIVLHNTAGTIDDPTDAFIIMYPGSVSNPATLGGSEALTNKTLGANFALASQAVTLAANTLTPSVDNPILVIAGTGPLNMIATPIAGEYKILINETGSNLTINHATGGTAANQIYTPNGTPIILPNNSSISVVYDSTLSKWVIAGGSGGGLAVIAITAAAINGTTLSPGIHYIVDMSALTAGTATTVTLPAGGAGLNLRVGAFGNLNNGCNLTIQPNGSNNIYQNGVAANTNYVMYTLESYVEFVWDSTGSTLGNCWVVEVPGSGSGGAGSSPLDGNYDETFLYYTRSDFGVDRKAFFGSVASGAVDSILGLGKIVYSGASQLFTSSDVTGPVFKADNPIINTAQVRLLYNTAHVDAAPVIAVSLDNGSTWTASYQQYSSGNFVVVDFTFTPGSVYTTGIKVKVTSSMASELAGFGINLVQDSTGAYGGDATKEIRVITGTEASTGLITLTSARFTPGAGQLHCNYKGHDFIEPNFVCLGGGAVQFPTNFFVTGDTAIFYVGYGLVNTSNAPLNIGNISISGSQRSGTGGYTYSTRATVVITNTHAAAISAILNPGTYLVGAQVSATSSVAANLAASIYVGGIEVTNRQYHPNSASGISSAFVQIPVVITVPGTVVALWASISAGTATNNTQELFITQVN